MTIVWAVILFGVLIFFHELGHFIAAKLVGVKVLKFALGFGPKVVGKKIGETEYLIAALPLGGYVKPLGEEVGEELSEEDKPRAFNFQPVWKRMTIVIAGPLFNFVLAYVIFVAFLTMGKSVIVPDLDRVTNTTIEHVEEGSPASLAGIKSGDKIVSVNGKEISTWLEVQETILTSPGKEIDLQIKRAGSLIDIKVSTGSRVIKDDKGEDLTIGTIGISKTSSAIGEVFEGTPAKEAGLQKDDVIVEIDGKAVSDWNSMALVFSENPGKELKIKVRRDNRIINMTVTPRPEKGTNLKGEEVVVGKIGIQGKTDVKLIEADSILEAPVKGVVAVYEWSALTINVVVKMVTGSISAKQVGGPILIVNVASKAASRSFAEYFNIIAMISVNLAILNLLPVPVLDGGHVLFLSLEALRRKPLSEKLQILATKVGMSLLLLLMAFVFYNDIVRFIVPWFQKSIIAN